MFDRTGGAKSTRAIQTAKTHIFAAPTKGYVRAQNEGAPMKGSAILLENWFPTTEGCRIRKGSAVHAFLADGVTHLAAFSPGAKMFATDATAIYDATETSETVKTAAVSGLTSGDWSSVEFTGAAGATSYLVMVNGTDSMRHYNGTAWVTITGASTPAITGVVTTALSHVWKHKSRLWFVQKESMSAWYLPVNSVAGAAVELPLGGVFSLGGYLLFGSTWSTDAGDGLDDYCLFVTTKGEVALYQGTDPSSASTWGLVGVYRIGVPLHKNAHFRSGGDVAVLTRDGIVSMAAAAQADRVGITMTAITAPIEEAWRQYVETRVELTVPFSCVLWEREKMLLIGMPTPSGFQKRTLACNARTGAWSSGFTGWAASCFVSFNDALYFGSPDGNIYQAEVGGTDNGRVYQAICIPAFDAFRTANEKSAVQCRAVMKTNLPYSFDLFCNADYVVNEPQARSADSFTEGNLWDVGLWDISVWGSEEDMRVVRAQWQAVAAMGHSLAPGVSITSGGTSSPEIELINLQLVYQEGRIMG